MGSGVAVARMLGVDDRGHFAILALIPAVLLIVGSLGAPAGVTYFLARGADASEMARRLRALVMLQVGILVPVHAVILFTLFRHADAAVREAAWFSLTAVPTGLAQMYGLAILQGQRRFMALNLFRLCPAGLYAVAVLTAYATGLRSLTEITAAWAIAGIAVAALAVLVARRNRVSAKPGFSVERREILRFGLRGVLGSTSPVEALRLDQAVTGLLLSSHALGLYVVGMSFTNFPRFIGQSVGLIAYPSVASRESKPEAHRAIAKFVFTAAVLSLATVGVIELTAGFLVPFFFGESFQPAVNVTRVLLLSAFFASMRRVVTDCAQGAGYPLFGSIAEISSWLVLVPALVLLTPRYGIEGVAIAMTLAYAASLLGLCAQLISAIRRENTSLAGGRDELRISRVLRARLHLRPGSLYSLTTPILAVCAGAAVSITSGQATWIVFGIVALAGSVLLVVSVRSTRTLASLLILCGAGTLAMTGLRVTNWMALSDVFFVGAALLLIPQVIMRTPERSHVRRVQTRGLCLVIVGGLLGSAVASNELASYAGLARLIVASLALIVLISAWQPSLGELKNVTVAWIASATLSAIWALKDPSADLGRPAGLAGHPNSLALTCVLALGPAVVLLQSARRSAQFPAALSIIALIAGVVVSGSRAGVLGTAVILVMGAFLFVRRAVPVGAVLLGLFVSLGLLGIHLKLPALNALSRLRNPQSQSVVASDIGHQQALGQTISIIKQHPLAGSGFENARAALDVYLQAWVSGGLLALIGFLVVAWATLTPLRVALRASTRGLAERAIPPEVLGLSVGFCGYLVASFFQNAIWERYVWFGPALIAAAWPLYAKRPAPARVPSDSPIAIARHRNSEAPA
jgi:O-antigen/teichoic acid export membrane protein